MECFLKLNMFVVVKPMKSTLTVRELDLTDEVEEMLQRFLESMQPEIQKRLKSKLLLSEYKITIRN